MITIFNRKELITTFSIEKQSEVRDILSANHIEYHVKTINRSSPSPMATGARARMGTYGQSMSSMYEYVIYVKKQDFEQAVFLINR